MKIELSHCPFCNGEVEFHKSAVQGEGGSGSIEHVNNLNGCPCRFEVLSSEDEFLIEKWNSAYWLDCGIDV
ncbi:Uncharacterised protein [uncultured archaeon]|nr:Uncharacterised protein [uncultured archaeon]